MLLSFRWMFPLAPLLLSHLPATAATAEPPPPQYGIKEDAPRLGSHIRREQMSGSPVAVNRPYAQLSEEDKANLHSWWENIPPGDEPPFPEAGLQAIYDPMRKAQDKLGEMGRLFASATVDEEGRVVSVSVFASPSEKITQVIGQVLMLTPFKPAICGGRPCQMDFPIRLNFKVSQL